MVEKLKFCGKCPCVRSCGQSSLPRMLKNNKVQDSSTLAFSSSSTTSSAPLLPRALSLNLDNNINGQSSSLRQAPPAAVDSHSFMVAVKSPATASEKSCQQDRMTSQAEAPLDLSTRSRESSRHTDDRVAKESASSVIARSNADGSHADHGSRTPTAAGCDHAQGTLTAVPPISVACSGNVCPVNLHMENLLKQIAKFKEVTLSRINELTSREINRNHSFVWPRYSFGTAHKSLEDGDMTRPHESVDSRPQSNWPEKTSKVPAARTWQEIMSDYGFRTDPEVAVRPSPTKANGHIASSKAHLDRNRNFRRSSMEYISHGLNESTASADEGHGGTCAGGYHLPCSTQFLKPRRFTYSPVSRGFTKDEPLSLNVFTSSSQEQQDDVLSFRKIETVGEGNDRPRLPTHMHGMSSINSIARERYHLDTDVPPYHSWANFSPSDDVLEKSKVTTSFSTTEDISNTFPPRSPHTAGLDNTSEHSSDDLTKVFDSCHHSNHEGVAGMFNNAMTLLQEERERLAKIDAIISTTSSKQSEAGSENSERNRPSSDCSDVESNRPNSAPNLSNNHLRDFGTRIMGKPGSAPPSVKRREHSTEGYQSLICRSDNNTPGLRIASDQVVGLRRTQNRKGGRIARSWLVGGGGKHGAAWGYQVRRIGVVTRRRRHLGRGRMRKRRRLF